MTWNAAEYYQRPEVKASEAAKQSRYAARKRSFLAGYKLMLGCKDCGYTAASEALDLDHVRGSKRWTPAMLPTKPWQAIRIEIEKCDVVCSNCHRIRSRRDWAKNHQANFKHRESICQ